MTQFSLTTYGSALAYGGWRFHASNMNLFLLSVLCVARDFLDTADSISQLWLILQWRFQGHQSLFSLTISGRLGRSFHWRFHWSTMTLFSLMISFVNRELVFAVHSIPQPWLNFHRLFLVLQWLSFCWRLMDQRWHTVVDDSMRQTWIYYCYRFYASLVIS